VTTDIKRTYNLLQHRLLFNESPNQLNVLIWWWNV